MGKREELMVTLEDAGEQLFLYTKKLKAAYTAVEEVPLWEAGGRVIAEEVVAKENIPSFNRSLVDGFALRSADTKAALPATFTVIDTVAAGAPTAKEVLPQTAIKIFTGAPLPKGCDCVIKREEVKENQAGTTITIDRSVETGEGVSYKGEDIAVGEKLIPCGSLLEPSHLAILATLGYATVKVYGRPKIGIFSTGNELCPVEAKPAPGQLRVSNLYSLAGIVRQAGGIPVSLGLVQDKASAVVQIYEQAQKLNLPLVLSTGGTASGDYDVVKAAMDNFAATRLFNKVAIRPGAPVVAAVTDKQLLLGLSGNPAGAVVAMLLLVYPLIAYLSGTGKTLETCQARLTASISRKGGLRSFFWAKYFTEGGQIFCTPQPKQFCGAVKTYQESNCFLELPPGPVDLAPGSLVTIWQLPR
ncbi:MAG: molybdopterin molybdotransferase MoeA [Firmicutes bacterium]|nr:molybdopterin molybdotransferase MoeA [Bacillota bacterium]